MGSPLGHRGHGERDTRLDHRREVRAAQHARADRKGRQPHRQPDEAMPEMVEPLLERGAIGLGALGQVADAPDLGVHRGCHDNACARALRDRRALEDHVGAVADLRVLVDGVGGFLDGGGFPGQHGLVDLQIGRLDQPEVRRDDVARLQHDQIARHDIARVDHLVATAPAHAGAHVGDLHQRLHRPRRAQFGEEADGGVDEQKRHDGDTLGQFAEGEGQAGREGQQPDDRALELVAQNGEQAPALLPLQRVGAVRLETRPGFLVGEAAVGIRVEARDHVLDGQREGTSDIMFRHACLPLRRLSDQRSVRAPARPRAVRALARPRAWRRRAMEAAGMSVCGTRA